MKCAIGQNCLLDAPVGAVAGTASYPSKHNRGELTRAAAWIVDFPTPEALCVWMEQWYAVGVRRAQFDDGTLTWLFVVHQEPDLNDYA